MNDLRLARLPDRTPVKLTITVSPDLNRALNDYAEVYRKTYGQKEKVEELIPFMLDRFIEGDAGFKKARRELLGDEQAAGPRPSPARPDPAPRKKPETGTHGG